MAPLAYLVGGSLLYHVPHIIKQCRIIMKLLIALGKLGSKLCARRDRTSLGTIEHILFALSWEENSEHSLRFGFNFVIHLNM